MTRRTALILALTPALCASLPGTALAAGGRPEGVRAVAGSWSFNRVGLAGDRYTGWIRIDRAGHVKNRTEWNGPTVQQDGHVRINGRTVEIVFTSHNLRRDAYTLDRFTCTMPEGDGPVNQLVCMNNDGRGRSPEFRLDRTR